MQPTSSLYDFHVQTDSSTYFPAHESSSPTFRFLPQYPAAASSSSPPALHHPHHYPPPRMPSPPLSASTLSSFPHFPPVDAGDVLELDTANYFHHPSPPPSSLPDLPDLTWSHVRPASPSNLSTSSSSSSSAHSASPLPHSLHFTPRPSTSPSFPVMEDSKPAVFSSSTSATSSHSASSTPTPPVKAPPTKRKRGAITPQQRAELKRMKHREIDAQRRQRESTVVSRLHQLNAWKVEKAGEEAGESSDEGDEFDEKKDKVSILEQSATKLAELQDLVRLLSRQCHTQEVNIEKLTLHLREVTAKVVDTEDDAAVQSSSALALLPRSTAEFISASDRSHALYRSCIMSASMSLFLVSVDTGRVLEANDVVYSSTGWKPEHVIDRSAEHCAATTAPLPTDLYA